MSHQCMVLISTSTGDIKREQSQRRLLSALESRKIAVETIDGADPELKERRDYLFSLSQKRGQYPQCFMRQLEDGSVTFLGDWDTVESWLECDSIPEEILAQNPSIMTFTKAFVNAVRVA